MLLSSFSPLKSHFSNFHLDWCPLQNQLVYNRLAQMCMYFELNPNNKASNWSTADSKCINMGMRLASNLTPLRMDAVLNMTTKNDGRNIERNLPFSFSYFVNSAQSDTELTKTVFQFCAVFRDIFQFVANSLYIDKSLHFSQWFNHYHWYPSLSIHF